MTVSEFLRMLKSDGAYISIYKYDSRYNQENTILICCRHPMDIFLGTEGVKDTKHILNAIVEYFYVTKLLNGQTGLELYIKENYGKDI